MAEADAALLIADDDERGKAEALAALHDLRDAIDVNELVEKLVVPVIAVILLAFAFASHAIFYLPSPIRS